MGIQRLVRALIAWLLLGFLGAAAAFDAGIAVADLPPEARTTLLLIDRGGPYPHKRDDVVFGNREKRLPLKQTGYYREYTVETPGVAHRGARRIVAGAKGERYYTEDHYRSFRRIRE